VKTLIAIIKCEYDENAGDPVNTFAFDSLFDQAGSVEVIDVDERDGHGEDGRYTVQQTKDMPLLSGEIVALVDNQSGGVIGYVRDEVATGIAVKLNREPT
jgi:hypothetical protein